ncbi:unnamed protein product [Plutella xylostella]|uniref:(diamondback moth) hypothetical protein n=1 Tax=Plutella xylostella TaxID=51655 RepID=A0A8S4FSF4_PLUXY|nr:unnamed protein product [Plutella xylostella]
MRPMRYDADRWTLTLNCNLESTAGGGGGARGGRKLRRIAAAPPPPSPRRGRTAQARAGRLASPPPRRDRHARASPAQHTHNYPVSDERATSLTDKIASQVEMPSSLFGDLTGGGGLVEDQRAFQLALELSLLNLGDLPPQNPLGSPLGFAPPPDDRAKKSQNMTECVPVPSSEHVAEIVGRQGSSSTIFRWDNSTESRPSESCDVTGA